MICEAKQPILDDNDSTRVSLLSWPFLKHRFLPELIVLFLIFDAFFGSSIFANGRRIAHEDGTGKFFYHNDHLGSPVVITDSNGGDTRFLEYFPYGTIKSETDGSVPNPGLALKHKFNSKELDDITGLYNYGARQYDAQLARFITPDPLEWRDASLRAIDGRGLQQFLTNPQNLNRYTYTLNNPLKYLDFSGQKVELAEKSVAGLGRHRFLILTPDNPADFKDNPRFVAPSQGASKISTVSGQPERPCPDCGNLVSRPNSDLNSKILAKVTIEPPQEGLSDTDFIKAILRAEASYQNDLPYSPEPKASPSSLFKSGLSGFFVSGSGYNSNSFARGILGAVGVGQPPNLGGYAPGFNKPISLPTALVSGSSKNQFSTSVFKSKDKSSTLF
jgi:RHS repeat-associated protein